MIVIVLIFGCAKVYMILNSSIRANPMHSWCSQMSEREPNQAIEMHWTQSVMENHWAQLNEIIKCCDLIWRLIFEPLLQNLRCPTTLWLLHLRFIEGKSAIHCVDDALQIYIFNGVGFLLRYAHNHHIIAHTLIRAVSFLFILPFMALSLSRSAFPSLFSSLFLFLFLNFPLSHSFFESRSFSLAPSHCFALSLSLLFIPRLFPLSVSRFFPSFPCQFYRAQILLTCLSHGRTQSEYCLNNICSRG